MKKIFIRPLHFPAYISFAQLFKITRVVRNSYGNPIPASIVVCKSPKAYFTVNKDGTFSINNIYNSDTLICEYLGYLPKKEIAEQNGRKIDDYQVVEISL